MSRHPGKEPTSAESNEVLAFLATAPAGVRDWADRQEALVREAQVAEHSAAADVEEASMNDIALAELDEIEKEDPVFRRRAKKQMDMHPAAGPVTGYSERRVILISLLIALIVGIGSGVYFANQANEIPAAAQQMEMPDGHPDITEDSSVSVARMAELEAQILADEGNVDALVELGALRFDNGEPEVAEEHWARALDIDPDIIEAHYNLGFAYLASDPPRPEQAVEAWNRVIELDPESDLADRVTLHLAAIASELDSGEAVDGDEGESP